MQPEDVVDIGHQAGRHLRSEGAGEPAATRDRFLDVIVLLSVAMFLVLAIGVGILALRSSFGT